MFQPTEPAKEESQKKNKPQEPSRKGKETTKIPRVIQPHPQKPFRKGSSAQRGGPIIPLKNQNPQLEQNIEKAKKSVLQVYYALDFISDDQESMKQELSSGRIPLMGYATMIGKREFISARHIFNNCLASLCMLYSPSTGKFYGLSVIEDGALGSKEKRKDYIIGFLEHLDIDDNEEELSCPPFLPMIKSPKEESHIALVNWTNTQKTFSNTSDYQKLAEITYSRTISTDSGSPYINFNGEMFALHCKRSEKELSNYARIAVPLERIGKFSKVLKTGGMESEKIVLNFPPSLLPMSLDIFPFFSTVIDALDQVDEAGEREHVLGDTPSVKGWSETVQKVLKRFYEKGKAEFRHIYKNINIIHKEGKLTIKNECSEELEKEIREKFDKNITTLIADKKLKKFWFVSVYPDKDSQKRKFEPLISKGERNNIHMGHKIPAICFWRYGADGEISYKEERIEKVKQNKRGKGKLDRTEEEIATKIKEINQKNSIYTIYKKSGVISYGEKKHRSNHIDNFMKDSRNYAFQTKTYNEKQGNEEKKRYGSYHEAEPTGFLWIPEEYTRKSKASGKTIKRTNHRLFPNTNSNYYRKFENLTDAFMIKINGKYVPLTEPNDVQWPPTYKGTQASKFLKRLNGFFDIKINKSNLNEKQINAIHKVLNSRAKTIKYESNDNFFLYSKKIPSPKGGTTRIVKAFQQKIDELNKIMFTPKPTPKPSG